MRSSCLIINYRSQLVSQPGNKTAGQIQVSMVFSCPRCFSLLFTIRLACLLYSLPGSRTSLSFSLFPETPVPSTHFNSNSLFRLLQQFLHPEPPISFTELLQQFPPSNRFIPLRPSVEFLQTHDEPLALFWTDAASLEDSAFKKDQTFRVAQV